MKVKEVTPDEMFGTSFHNDTILSSVNELSKLFGEPYSGDFDKTYYEWYLSYDNIPFCIYDWKEYREIDLDEMIEFHIGTRTKEESNLITNILNKILDNGINA